MAHPPEQDSEKPKKPTAARFGELWPDMRELIRPRKKTLLLGLLLILISRAAGFVLPASTKYVIDDVLSGRNPEWLGPIVIAILAATVIQAVSGFAVTQLLSKAGQSLIAEMRRKVQEHIGRLPVSFYDAHQTGTLVSRIMSDVEGLRNLVGTGLAHMFGGVITAAGALVVLLYLSAGMTLLSLALVGVFVAILLKAFSTLRPAFRKRRKLHGEVSGRLTESLGGVRVVKGYHAEAREARVFSDGIERILQNVFTTITGTSLVSVSAHLLLGGLSGLLLWMGGTKILAGEMELGDLVAFTVFSAVFIAPLFQIVNISTQLMEAVAGLERTREVLTERPEDEDPQRTMTLDHIDGRVEFENVDFAYEEGKQVLHGVSFTSEPGTVTALVGSSGSGKSTIIGLVSAFHVPQGGRVLLDGRDLSKLQLSAIRPRLGVVLQDTFLFDGTIRENVSFARPDSSNEQIIEACRIARVDEFAERFEDGYETIVGERGVKLSGGQRQRVAIARAVLADPRILILDEATSSLDSDSEALIQEGLSYLMRGRTTFVIAHRLSTIRRADQILVVEGGEIVERGNHAALYESAGRYRELYDKQHGLETNLFLAPGEGDTVTQKPASDSPAPSAGESLGILRS